MIFGKCGQTLQRDQEVTPRPVMQQPPMSPSKAAQNSPRSSPSTKLRFPSASAAPEDDVQSTAVSIPRFYNPPASPTAEQMSEFSAAATAAFEAHGGTVTPSELRLTLPSLCQCPGFLAHVRLSTL